MDRVPSGSRTNRLESLGSFDTKADADRAVAIAITDGLRGQWASPALGRRRLSDRVTSVSVVVDRYGHLFPGHEATVMERLEKEPRPKSGLTCAFTCGR